MSLKLSILSQNQSREEKHQAAMVPKMATVVTSMF